MNSKNKRWILLGAWMTASLVLLLFPAPWEWGMFGDILSTIHDKAGPIVQPAVHFFLMFGFAVLVTGFFSEKTPVHTALRTIGIAAGFAIGLELLQSFLPEKFSRECDPLDLLPSLAGAICGSISCLVLHLRFNKS